MLSIQHSPSFNEDTIKNPRRKQRGIEDFSLKSLRMRENKFPASQVHAPRGEVLDLPFVNKKFRNMKQDRNGMKIVYTDIMRLEIGPSLIPLCDEKFNLVQKIGTMRKNREKESGISIPSIYIIDRKVKHKIKGKEVKDLVFGVPAI